MVIKGSVRHAEVFPMTRWELPPWGDLDPYPATDAANPSSPSMAMSHVT